MWGRHARPRSCMHCLQPPRQRGRAAAGRRRPDALPLPAQQGLHAFALLHSNAMRQFIVCSLMQHGSGCVHPACWVCAALAAAAAGRLLGLHNCVLGHVQSTALCCQPERWSHSSGARRRCPPLPSKKRLLLMGRRVASRSMTAANSAAQEAASATRSRDNKRQQGAAQHNLRCTRGAAAAPAAARSMGGGPTLLAPSACFGPSPKSWSIPGQRGRSHRPASTAGWSKCSRRRAGASACVEGERVCISMCARAAQGRCGAPETMHGLRWRRPAAARGARPVCGRLQSCNQAGAAACSAGWPPPPPPAAGRPAVAADTASRDQLQAACGQHAIAEH